MALVRAYGGGVAGSDIWAPYYTSSTATNDSDITFTLNRNATTLLDTVYVSYTSTATLGNRQLVIEFADSSANVIASVYAASTQAASLTYQYTFGTNLPRMTATYGTGNSIMTPLPQPVLQSAYTVRVYDIAAVDAAADDMVIRITGLTRGV